MEKKKFIAKCLPFDQKFADKFAECENYVALNSYAFNELFNWDENTNTPSEYEGLVCVRYKDNSGMVRKVYRKAVGHSALNFTKYDVMIGYRTRKSLHIDMCNNPEVEITPTCWFRYLLKHPNSAIRCPFIIALIFGVISLLSFILSILSCCEFCT